MTKYIHTILPAVSVIIFLSTLPGCSDDSLKYYNLGVEAAERGELSAAVEHWQKSLQKRPDDPDTHFNLGSAFLELGRFPEAEKHLAIAAEIMPGDHEIHYALGKALENQDLLSEAKKAYKMSISVQSNFYPPYIGLASIALKQQQYKTAEKYASQGLNVSPRDLDGNMILSEAYFLQGNFQEAYAQLLSIRGIYAANPDVLLLMGKIMCERNMHSDAITSLKLAKENGASGADVFLYLGRSSYALEQYSDAEKYYGLSSFKDPSDPRAWKGLADTFFQTGEYDKSMEAWQNAAGLSPGDPDIDLGISMVYINTKHPESAVPILEKLRQTENAPSRTLYYLGHALMRSGQKEKAREAFKEFIVIWEGNNGLIDEVNKILLTL